MHAVDPPRVSFDTTSKAYAHTRAAVAHSRDYKKVLHAFQMDDTAIEYSSRSLGRGDSFTADGAGVDASSTRSEGGGRRWSETASGITASARGKRLSGMWGGSKNTMASGAAAGVEVQLADLSGKRAGSKLGSVRHTPSIGGNSVGGGAGGGGDGGADAVSIDEALAASDTPAGVCKALLERHQVTGFSSAGCGRAAC